MSPERRYGALFWLESKESATSGRIYDTDPREVLEGVDVHGEIKSLSAYRLEQIRFELLVLCDEAERQAKELNRGGPLEGYNTARVFTDEIRRVLSGDVS